MCFFLIYCNAIFQNIFIAGGNVLFKLDSNLTVLVNTAISGTNNTSDNENTNIIKVLLIDDNVIIVCTTFKGQCFMRDIDSLSRDIEEPIDFISRDLSKLNQID